MCFFFNKKFKFKKKYINILIPYSIFYYHIKRIKILHKFKLLIPSDDLITTKSLQTIPEQKKMNLR